MQRRKKTLFAVIAATLLCASSLVWAGVKSYFPVSVNTVHKYANGAMGDTRNTPDSVQYVECGSNTSTGYCTIRDSSGTYYSCYTTDPALIEVIRAMSGDALFSVRWNDSNHCTYVLSYASSRAQPKAH